MNDNGIATRQNEARSIDLLAAQRQLYSEAKNISHYQFFCCILIPALLPFLKMANLSDPFLGLIILVAVVITLVNTLFFEKIIKHKRECAAKIQEFFDTYVLQIPWNKEISGAREHAIRDYSYFSQKYKQNNISLENLKDWYPTEYADLNIAVGRVLCQKVNASYDEQIRIKFKYFLILLFWLSVMLFFVISIIFNKSFVESLVLFFAPLVPVTIYLHKRLSENLESMIRLENILNQADALVEESKSASTPATILEAGSRKLQNDLFKHRSSAFLIWDWFYFMNRAKQESNMKVSAKLNHDDISQREDIIKE
ncbi:S-4TM family putative pore-forming effector [Cohnella cellulosilytica]|uniref:S-4TM family putative pore-forming effector n=2 Tax=Cohnella cellulosilytica TaxID=986710 RepID=A0ABW2FBG4_9BACL